MELTYTPGCDWFTQHIPSWEEHLHHLRGLPGLHFLEIGSFEGRSAVWLLQNILTHPASRLTCIDLFERREEAFNIEEHMNLNLPRNLPVEKHFDCNIRAIGAEKRVRKLKGISQEILRTLPPDAFDLVYIDGSHEAKNVLTDAVLAFDLLKNNGIMILDDYRWECFPEDPARNPPIAIDAFLSAFRGWYDLLHKDYQMMIRKRPGRVSPTDHCAPPPGNPA
ncbi:MAG: class I SAM-dependent methyltransferase [Candidatus Peribacteraceae bacterium]